MVDFIDLDLDKNAKDIFHRRVEIFLNPLANAIELITLSERKNS